MSEEREIVAAEEIEGEDRVDAALRPKRLAEFVGQERVREQLSLVLESAQRRGKPPDHVLLSGAPGLGKTSLAMIIAAELGTGIRITSGPALERAGDLAALVSSLQAGEVLFIDEIHRISRPAEELLYVAMEDFRVDVIVGKGPGSTAIPLDVEHRLFEPFFSTRSRGSGLGLYICRELCERHGASIDFHPAPASARHRNVFGVAMRQTALS